jgi:hypothetical protein
VACRQAASGLNKVLPYGLIATVIEPGNLYLAPRVAIELTPTQADDLATSLAGIPDEVFD